MATTLEDALNFIRGLLQAASDTTLADGGAVLSETLIAEATILLHGAGWALPSDPKKTVLRVTLEHDPDVSNPCEDYSSWQLYSFNRRHPRFLDPDEIDGKFPDLRALLATGTAFWLGYFEHGDCQWALSGEQRQCDFDSVSRAGILVWEDDPKGIGDGTREALEASARDFLVEYTNWCNGNCYGYAIEKAEVTAGFDGDPSACEWEDVDSCWGYIGEEWIVDQIRSSIERGVLADAEIIEIAGDCKWIADFHKLKPSPLGDE